MMIPQSMFFQSGFQEQVADLRRGCVGGGVAQWSDRLLVQGECSSPMEHMGDETIHDQIVQQHHTDEFVLNCDAVDIWPDRLFRTNFLPANIDID